MAVRPAWQGHLKLSLVTCPVALYAATGSGRGVSFNLINPETGNRIRMVPTDPDTGPVHRADLVRGYAVDRELYVLVSDAELRALKLESTGTIAIERFAPETEIDRLYWDAPYYLVPDGELAQEPFAVIREAMRAEGQVALARVVIANRERLLALEPRGKGIVAHALRPADEVRDADEAFRAISDAPADPAMVAIAKQIVAQHAGPFDPSAFRDRYAEAVRELVKAKTAQAAPTRARAPDEAEVIDLMAALKASLAPPAQDRRRRAGPGHSAAKAARRAPKPAARTVRRKAN